MSKKTLPFAHIRKCDGEAHSNPYIDNCGVCAPHWGFTIHCASCGTQLQHSRRGVLNRKCPTCGTTHARIDYRAIWVRRNETIYAKLNRLGWKRTGSTRVFDFYHKGNWIAIIPSSIDSKPIYTRNES